MTLPCPPQTVVRCLALALALHAAPAYGLEPLNPPAKASAPADVVRRVDELLARAAKPTVMPPAADDETFLRRISLDLTGKLPSDAEAAAFRADTAPGRKGRLIERLLTSEAHA